MRCLTVCKLMLGQPIAQVKTCTLTRALFLNVTTPTESFESEPGKKLFWSHVT